MKLLIRFLVKLFLLNLIVGAVSFVSSILWMIFNDENFSQPTFRVDLMFLMLFTGNLIYLVGNGLELLESKLWKEKSKPQKPENRYFKSALIIVAIVWISYTSILAFNILSQ